jgi:hypothetical protein
LNKGGHAGRGSFTVCIRCSTSHIIDFALQGINSCTVRFVVG